jgi:hypothetical protein
MSCDPILRQNFCQGADAWGCSLELGRQDAALSQGPNGPMVESQITL